MIDIKIVDFCQLYKEDLKLIEAIRSIGFGEVTIKIRDKKPTVIEKGIMTIRLDNKI